LDNGPELISLAFNRSYGQALLDVFCAGTEQLETARAAVGERAPAASDPTSAAGDGRDVFPSENPDRETVPPPLAL